MMKSSLSTMLGTVLWSGLEVKAALYLSRGDAYVGVPVDRRRLAGLASLEERTREPERSDHRDATGLGAGDVGRRRPGLPRHSVRQASRRTPAVRRARGAGALAGRA